MSTLRIRLSRPSDIPGVLRLLPGIAHYPSQTLVYIAEDNGEPAGCGALVFHSESVCAFNWNFYSRDQKMISAPSLFSVFQAEAERQRMRLLIAQSGVPENSGDNDLLQSLGCHEHVAFNFYETDIERTEKLFNDAVTRLQKSNKIPATAQIISLEQAPASPVQALWRDSIGVGGDALMFQFEQRQFSPGDSVVAMDGSRVVGAVGLNLSGKIPIASYMAVEKSYRGRWPYPLLMQAVHAGLRKKGHAVLHFKTNPQHHAGIKNFAGKIGGKPCGREIFYAVEL
jgi:hypothetical protein